MKADLVIRDVKIFSNDKLENGDLAFCEGKIIHTHGKFFGHFNEEHLFSGAIALPGLIDSQVHFREPGLIHKEDLESGSQSAVMGGICTYFEMPNTNPSTSTVSLIRQKCEIASRKSWANYGFFIGATGTNTDQLILAQKEIGCIGVKIFLGSSTGNLLLFDKESLLEIFEKVSMTISIHSEDEDLLNKRIQIKNDATSVHAHLIWRNEETALLATKRIVQLARQKNKKIHILHVTSKAEIEFLASQKDICTVEVTPQHLTLFAPDCYDRLGTLAQMNPPIREDEHRQALWKALKSGVIDVIGSDHAPHTLEEKNKGYPNTPSGMPGVQTTLPLLLNYVNQKKLALNDVVRLLAINPAKIFNLKNKGKIEIGMDADITLVDLEKSFEIKNQDQKSKVAWTPFHGTKGKGCPVATIVSGAMAMKENNLINKNAQAIKRF